LPAAKERQSTDSPLLCPKPQHRKIKRGCVAINVLNLQDKSSKKSSKEKVRQRSPSPGSGDNSSESG